MDRLCSDAFVLQAVSAAKTTTTVDYKRGADVNRLRNDVFVLRILRCLTFEVSGEERNDSGRPRMKWRACSWQAVERPLDRRG